MLRLADLSKPREIRLGYGVTVTMTALNFTDLRTAQAMSYRQAVREVDADLEAGELALADPAAREEREARIVSRSEQIIFDRLAARHITGWTGLTLEDGVTPAPFTPETWVAFRTALPYLAEQIQAEMRMPADLLVREGNA